jgi:hypothetical protein
MGELIDLKTRCVLDSSPPRTLEEEIVDMSSLELLECALEVELAFGVARRRAQMTGEQPNDFEQLKHNRGIIFNYLDDEARYALQCYVAGKILPSDPNAAEITTD